MREGRSGRAGSSSFPIVGEYEIPFHAVVLHKVLESSEGELMNLFQFTNLARNNWEEAVKLFYSPDFIRVFNGQDKKYRNLYKGFSQIPGNMQNVEEFLVSIHKKQPVEYMLPRTEIVITNLHGQLCGNPAGGKKQVGLQPSSGGGGRRFHFHGEKKSCGMKIFWETSAGCLSL